VRRADARRLYYSLELLTAMPGWVVVDLYLVRTLHFSPLELILVGSATEAAIVVGEIPTGVVADTYSRRLSVIIGLVGMGASVVLIVDSVARDRALGAVGAGSDVPERRL
jgi:MFS transporter, DHA3 family, tetracycline resistance protein